MFESLSTGLYPGVLGRGLFCENCERNRTLKILGIKIAGISCKIWELCMILKKWQLGMGPVFRPCETRDKALQYSSQEKYRGLCGSAIN